LGFGGISVVHLACGLSRRAIAKGIREIQEGVAPSEGRVRGPGAGRKSITVSDPHLLAALEEMIDCQTRRLDRRKYPTGRTVSDEEMKRINVERNKFHGDWN
jgi:hypothetical protein